MIKKGKYKGPAPAALIPSQLRKSVETGKTNSLQHFTAAAEFKIA